MQGLKLVFKHLPLVILVLWDFWCMFNLPDSRKVIKQYETKKQIY